MVKYFYMGDSERTFPSASVTVKKGETFDGPAGITAPGLSIVPEEKPAPAVEKKKEKSKEKPLEDNEIIASDTTVGDDING